MSPLRFLGSLAVSSRRRIGGQALGSAKLLRHHSRNLGSGVCGSVFAGRLPMGGSRGSIVTMGALLSVLVGGVWYFKEEPSDTSKSYLVTLLPEGPCASFLLPLIIAARKTIHHHVEALEEESMEEKVMKRRFEEWMTEFGREYKDKEEKAMRYQVFKRTAQFVDQYNAKGSGCTIGTNDFADQTEEESRCCGGCGPAHMHKEEELMLIRRREEEELMRIRRCVKAY